MGVPQRSSSTVRLLIVDADPDARRTIRSALEARITRPLLIMEATDAGAARALASDRAFDVFVVDLATAGGLDGFGELASRAPGATLYAAGPASDVQTAVGSVRAGAADFIEKPIDGAAFARRIERQFIETRTVAADEFEGLTGQSPAMRALIDQIQRIAPSHGPVFVSGAPGTGKSLVARAVHARSRRKNGPFITVDCSGTAPDALLRELTDVGGAIERADGGTLFLDEVGFLPEAVQAVLARFLGTSEVSTLSGVISPSVRVVASSNRGLAELRGPAGLRQDLYFRLAVLTLSVPALTERSEDMPALIDGLIREANRRTGGRYTRFHTAAIEALATHDWPGNARELRHVIELLTSQHNGDLVTAAMVAPLLNKAAATAPGAAERAKTAADVRPLWMEEARIIDEAIAAFGGNIARAAAALEISPSTIYRKRRDPEENGARVA
jgi:two-component system repressor protein LuxO